MRLERGDNWIGVDYDEHDGYRFIRGVLNAARFGDVHAYYTNHGFHIIITRETHISYTENLAIRRLLGDDCDRVAVDDERVRFGRDLRRFDTTFWGRVKDGEAYVRREIDPFACGPFPVQGEGVDSSVGGS